MITENEKAAMRVIEEAFHTQAFQLVGTNLATMDALFAIREGTEWRGRVDPKEIAREVLRIGGVGE